MPRKPSSAFSFKIRLFDIEGEYIYWKERVMSELDKQARAEFLYVQSIFNTAAALSMGNPRIPNLANDLIECSVCHKLIEEPDIEECEFCNEDVCDNCWDKHQCEPYDYAGYE